MVYCTSRHDLSHILHCKNREFLLSVHTDHPVTQPTHGQHRLPGRRNPHFWRSAGHTVMLLLKPYYRLNSSFSAYGSQTEPSTGVVQ